MKPILMLLGNEPLYSYPLFMGLAWGIGYHLILHQFDKTQTSKKGFQLFFWGTFITSWIGAKLFFLFFSANDQIANLSFHQNFWLGGGFVFLGGFVFSALYHFLLAFVFKKFTPHQVALCLPGVALGHAIGRVGCLLAGCCFGHQCHLPWKVYLHGEFRHPVQIYEALCLLILSYIMSQLNDRWGGGKGLLKIVVYFMSYGIIRFSLEFFRGDLIRGVWFGFSTSQWISLLMFLMGLSYLIKQKTQERI